MIWFLSGVPKWDAFWAAEILSISFIPNESTVVVLYYRGKGVNSSDTTYKIGNAFNLENKSSIFINAF